MRTGVVALLSLTLFIFTFIFIVVPAQAQDSSTPTAQQDASSSQSTSGDTFEGTVVSVSRSTLVLRTDDDQFHLFRYEQSSTRPTSLTTGSRVRVNAGSP